ncbi:MAG: DinB family protein [Fimbriimonadaceae bacterium]|nr:DinB family protein [Chthonomonadaceae bacterium]MCO5296995.1 DinB family protein [Fimbriimonadaceae bacterium]
MAYLDPLLKALDSAHWEMSEAFKGLPDTDVWRRPDPRLLSVGELAAHVAFGEAQTFLGDTEVESPLLVPDAAYYTANVGQPFTVPLGADALYQEVQRIHERCKAAFADHPHDSEEPCPNREGWTWGYAVEYQAFHVAYHVGQMFSVRHLLGHETPDN